MRVASIKQATVDLGYTIRIFRIAMQHATNIQLRSLKHQHHFGDNAVKMGHAQHLLARMKQAINQPGSKKHSCISNSSCNK